MNGKGQVKNDGYKCRHKTKFISVPHGLKVQLGYELKFLTPESGPEQRYTSKKFSDFGYFLELQIVLNDISLRSLALGFHILSLLLELSSDGIVGGNYWSALLGCVYRLWMVHGFAMVVGSNLVICYGVVVLDFEDSNPFILANLADLSLPLVLVVRTDNIEESSLYIDLITSFI
ncbi:hypothetical protein CFP56_005878 [Quercus suber]|uniref:Uncharacterized protein n=1 Tax=Quercus suber TaxID=58331 RepID=A0AAW0M826_QUESU